MDAISSSGSKRGDERRLLAGAEDSSICFSVVSKAGQALLWPARPAKPKEGPNHFTSLSGCPSKSCLIPSQLGIRKSVFAYLSGVLSVAVSKKKKIVQYVASDKTVGLLDGFALVTTQHNTTQHNTTQHNTTQGIRFRSVLTM